jgi:hypothetical protein
LSKIFIFKNILIIYFLKKRSGYRGGKKKKKKFEKKKNFWFWENYIEKKERNIEFKSKEKNVF